MGERERTQLIGRLRSLPQRGDEVWQAGIAQMPVWVGEELELSEAVASPGALSGAGVDVERMRAFAEAARRFYLAAPWRHLNDYDLIQIESPRVPKALSFVSVMGSGGMQYGLGFFESRRVYERMYEATDPAAVLLGQGTAWSVTYGPIQELPLPDADLFADHGLPVAADRAYPVALGMGEEGVQRPDAGMLTLLEGLLIAIGESTEDELDAGRWRKMVRTHDGEIEFVLSITALLEQMREGGRDGAKAASPEAGMRQLERQMRGLLERAREAGLSSKAEMNAFMQQQLAAPAAPRAPRTPAEEAQELIYDAMDAVGRRQVQLIRRALAIDPDCVDAHNLLGDRTGDPRESEPLYRRAADAARRSLDPSLFERGVGHFWGIMETRPYMRALYGLAGALDRQGRVEEAIERYQEMLRLNPNDNQGARYALAPLLYRAGKLEELKRLLERYDEPSAATLYLKALLLFRTEGDSAASRAAASRALRENRHMEKYLSGRSELPPAGPPVYSPGSEEEAVVFACDLIDLWEEMPGALRWLAKQKPAAKAKKAAKGRGASGKKKGKRK